MRIVNISGQDYRLPSRQNIFQEEMYIHLINWKWQHISFQPVGGAYQ